MDVPRYHSPRLVRRALKITAFVWLMSIGYSAAAGVWAYAWWNPLFWVTLMGLGIAVEWEQRLVTRWAIDRLQARLAKKRGRRREMKATKGAPG